jgi:hypothetical protein
MTHDKASWTSPVVTALVEGGATCIGKTVVDELAYGYLPSGPSVYYKYLNGLLKKYFSWSAVWSKQRYSYLLCFIFLSTFHYSMCLVKKEKEREKEIKKIKLPFLSLPL